MAKNEHPIPFTTPMVSAVLAGLKSQTRRLVRTPAPAEATSAGVICSPGRDYHDEWSWLSGDPKDVDSWTIIGDPFRCPYGVPSDRLWVRESWAAGIEYDDIPPRDIPKGAVIGYRTDDKALNGLNERMSESCRGKWRPGMFLPRWASRINLENLNIRVERLQDISEDDAKAEGTEPYDIDSLTDDELFLLDAPLLERGNPYRNGYALLWESLNGAGSWAANPMVWVINFQRTEE